jgi:hypothetical protein
MMKHRHQEVRGPFNKAQSFGRRLENSGKNVVIFPIDQTVQSYIGHKSERAFRQQLNPLRHVQERHNTDVTQMIF